MYVQAKNFTECYYKLVQLVYEQSRFTCAPRGQKIKEQICVCFEIEDPRDRILFVPERKFSIQYMIAEALWYFLGDNKTEWISNYASFWENISDDGETANSAYGARIFKPHNYIADGMYTQWDYVKEELTRDRDSRRAVIHIRLPEDSIYAQKDMPCTLALQFFIREDKLYMVTHMRSSDLILGISYDVPAFTLFQEFLANELGVGLGSYKHVSNSLHVYERHFDMCGKILAGQQTNPMVVSRMPEMPKHIPVKELDMLQREVRRSETRERLEMSWAISNSHIDDEYFQDWGIILAAHRAKKLKIDDTFESFMSLLKFRGYAQFPQ